MKLRATKREIELPEPLDESSLELSIWSNGDGRYNPHSFLFRVERVSPAEMIELVAAHRKDIFAMPYVFCVAWDGVAKLQVFPPPDRDYVAVFRFNPPAKEI